MDLQQQISTALGRAMSEALPNTPSGSHKMFVVGQIVVNVTHPVCAKVDANAQDCSDCTDSR